MAVRKPLIREDLDFAKEHDTHRAFNRYATHRPHAELTEALDRRAWRLGVRGTPGAPAHTSAEGRWRFAEDRGWRDLVAFRAKHCTRWRKRRGARDGPWGALGMLRRQRWGRPLCAGSGEDP